MGKTTTALAVKFVMTFAAAWIAVSLIAGNEWTWALWVGILGTIINYVIGDRFFLPNYGNMVASVAGGILGAGLLFMLDMLSADLSLNATWQPTFFLLVAVGEYFFHRYLIGAGIVEASKEKA
ncbi:MAG: YndM family protein [Firmicutes bacterium]|nr:YndM family protein [Bacillota bacterium]